MRPSGNLTFACVANGEKRVISLDSVGAKGSGRDPWTTLGLDGETAPHTCHLLFCADGIMALVLGRGQKEVEWSLDSHLHQTTGLERVAWTWAFPALLRKLKFRTLGVGWVEREWWVWNWLEWEALVTSGGFPWCWEVGRVGAGNLGLELGGRFKGTENFWQERRGVCWLHCWTVWECPVFMSVFVKSTRFRLLVSLLGPLEGPHTRPCLLLFCMERCLG